MKFLGWLWTPDPAPPLTITADPPNLAVPLYQALIYIRDHPKGAKRNAKRVVESARPSRYLYRQMLRIEAHPDRALEVARAAVAETQSAMRLLRALREIRDNPKQAAEIAERRIVEEAKIGACVLGVQ